MKYYNIWINDYGFYQALFSYSNKKTTDKKNFKYAGTIKSISAKDAIEDFYKENKNLRVLDKKSIEITNDFEKNIILWSKKLREDFPSCPLKTALLLSRKLFEQEQDKLIFNPEDFSNLNFKWLKDFRNSSSIYYKYPEPNIPFSGFYMFGEQQLLEEQEKNITNIISQILDLAEEDKKEKIFYLMQELLNLNNNDSSYKII